jgi:trimeric autotransporter adhesin
MAYQPKSYRKFLAGSVSAALVATAVGPVVASAASFSDVNPNDSHAANIEKLVEKGYIKGYEDGTFKPYNNVTRGQVAKIFARILKDNGFQVPADKKAFDDVPVDAKDQELVEAAAIVKAAGVMTGNEGKLNPNQTMTRQQMAKVLVEAFDLTKPADFTSKITDLDKADEWARDYIKTLEANGVTVVTEYNPKGTVTRAAFASFVVRALEASSQTTAQDIQGVQYVDQNTLEVTFNGELKDVKKEDFAIEGVEIDSVSIKAAAAEEAKTTVVVIKTKTPLEEGKSYTISYKGQTTDKTKVDVPVVTPKVESVSAINLKTVKVTFNKALNPDALGTIQIKDANNNTVTLDSTQGTKLSADGKVLSITASGLFTQGAEYSLKIEGAKTVDGKEVTAYDGKFTALDTTVPVVESATITSPKTIEIAFSEPVTSSLFTSGIDAFAGVLTNLVQIDGVNAYVDDISFDYATNKMQLKLNTALTAGEHTIKVMGFKDHAGFPVEAKEFKSSLAADTAAPTVTSVQVLQYNKVRVTFDEVVSTPVAANFTISVGGTNYTVTQVDAVAGDQKSYDLTVSPDLGLGAVVDATLKYKNIKDFYNNEVTTEKTFSFKASDETTAPTVVSHTLNSDNTVELTFSEDVEGLQAADFELLDKDNKVVTGGVTNVQAKTINNVVSKKVYTVTLASSVNAGSNYTLKLKKDSVNDFSIRKNTNAEQTFALSTKDLVKPNVSAVLQTLENANTTVNTDTDALDTKLVIYFDEAMDKTTLENKANYLINNAPIGSNVTVTPAQDGKSVTLVINRTAPETQQNFTAGGNATIKVLNLKDVAGNLVDDFNVDLTVNNYSSTANIISDVQLVAKNQIKIVPNEGHVISAVDLNDIQVVDNDSQTVYAQATRVVSYNSTDGSVTVELSRNLGSDVSAATAIGTDIAVGDSLRVKFTGDAVTNAQGQTQALTADNGTAFYDATITDKVKPSLVVTDTDNDGLIDVNDTNNTITLTFDENVYASTAELEAALVIKDKDGKRLGTSAYDVTVDTDTNAPHSKTVVITLLPGATEYVGNYTITLSDNVSLKDIAGNLANDIATVTTESLTVESQASADAAAVAAAKAALAIGYATGDSANSVTQNLTLPTTSNGATITWASDNPSVVATNGTVTRPASGQPNATVTLTATITKGAATDTKTFTVTVKAQ